MQKCKSISMRLNGYATFDGCPLSGEEVVVQEYGYRAWGKFSLVVEVEHWQLLRAQQMRTDGATYREIGNALGLDYSSVYRHLHRDK
jgi:hypothetical protein